MPTTPTRTPPGTSHKKQYTSELRRPIGTQSANSAANIVCEPVTFKASATSTKLCGFFKHFNFTFKLSRGSRNTEPARVSLLWLR